MTVQDSSTAPDYTAMPGYHPSYGERGILLRLIGPTAAIVEEDWTSPTGTVVRKGYFTDGASSRRWAYAIVDPFGIALPRSVEHDKDYDPIPDGHGVKRRTKTRREADRDWRIGFLEDLDLNNKRKSRVGRGVAWASNRARAWLGWTAIRLGGWRPWNAGTKRGTLNVGDTL